MIMHPSPEPQARPPARRPVVKIMLCTAVGTSARVHDKTSWTAEVCIVSIWDACSHELLYELQTSCFTNWCRKFIVVFCCVQSSSDKYGVALSNGILLWHCDVLQEHWSMLTSSQLLFGLWQLVEPLWFGIDRLHLLLTPRAAVFRNGPFVRS